jgi:2-amino-4-hydroxy-6-hydroxymethyldihydropteridine diphosphokinase
MSLVYLCLGSNLGDRFEMIDKAITEIEKTVGSVMARSAFYETESWGYESSNKFINACIAVKTDVHANECIITLKNIENLLGRTKTTKIGYSDRLIDIDILLYDDMVINEDNLIIPHPMMQKRNFVLNPLREIAPDIVHPVLKKTISELLEELNSQP